MDHVKWTLSLSGHEVLRVFQEQAFWCRDGWMTSGIASGALESKVRKPSRVEAPMAGAGWNFFFWSPWVKKIDSKSRGTNSFPTHNFLGCKLRTTSMLSSHKLRSSSLFISYMIETMCGSSWNSQCSSNRIVVDFGYAFVVLKYSSHILLLSGSCIGMLHASLLKVFCSTNFWEMQELRRV